MNKSSSRKKGFLKGFSTKMTAYVFQNKLVLYILLLVSIFNILYLGVQGQMEYIFVFIILAFLTIFFTKNMILILIISLFMTNALIFFNLIDCQCDRGTGKVEGYSGNNRRNGGEDDDEEEEEPFADGNKEAAADNNSSSTTSKKKKEDHDDDGGGGGGGAQKHDLDFKKFEDMNSKLVGEINGQIIPKLEYMEKFLKSYEKENFSKP